jgi:hypothetical protein
LTPIFPKNLKENYYFLTDRTVLFEEIQGFFASDVEFAFVVLKDGVVKVLNIGRTQQFLRFLVSALEYKIRKVLILALKKDFIVG